MSGSNFLRAVTAGFIATFAMTMMGFWQAGIGLPKFDVGALLAANMGHEYGWGQAAHFIDGMLLALIYARWLYGMLPGPALVKGIVYGIIATIAAQVVVVPLVTAPLAEPAGFFFARTPMPGMMMLGSLIIHLAYGITLGILYIPAEEASRR